MGVNPWIWSQMFSTVMFRLDQTQHVIDSMVLVRNSVFRLNRFKSACFDPRIAATYGVVAMIVCNLLKRLFAMSSACKSRRFADASTPYYRAVNSVDAS